MIDKKTGQIIISDKIRIGHNSAKQDILSLQLGQTSKQWDNKNGWTWVAERNVYLDNLYFILNFCFLDNKLKEIHFVVNDTKYEQEKSWDNWSEKQEQTNLMKYKVWLTNELGTQENFDWGSVSALYDVKSGGSSIYLRYK